METDFSHIYIIFPSQLSVKAAKLQLDPKAKTPRKRMTMILKKKKKSQK